MVLGEPTIEPRVVPAPVRMPLPPADHQGSIYENQRGTGPAFLRDLRGAGSCGLGSCVLVLAFATIGPVAQATEKLKIGADHGTIDFAIGNSKIFRTTGSFKNWQGTVNVDDAEVPRSTVAGRDQYRQHPDARHPADGDAEGQRLLRRREVPRR